MWTEAWDLKLQLWYKIILQRIDSHVLLVKACTNALIASNSSLCPSAENRSSYPTKLQINQTSLIQVQGL